MKQNLNSKKVVAIFGPPGSGKGTQANLLSLKYNLFHFDTGRFLERLVFDPKNYVNEQIRKEKKKFESGILMTPSFVLKLVKKGVLSLYKNGEGIIFSGSPRTEFEAFGDSKNIGLIKFLEKLYGKKNINFILIKVLPKISIRRNFGRVVCSVCGGQLLSVLKINLKQCPFCGGILKKREAVDDSVDIIKKRLIEYEKVTKPVIDGLKKEGYKVYEVDGSALPYKVFELISKRLNDSFKK